MEENKSHKIGNDVVLNAMGTLKMKRQPSKRIFKNISNTLALLLNNDYCIFLITLRKV